MYYIIVQDQDGQNISIKTNEELRQIKCGCGDQQVDGHKYWLTSMNIHYCLINRQLKKSSIKISTRNLTKDFKLV
jgi:hypothetical protein